MEVGSTAEGTEDPARAAIAAIKACRGQDLRKLDEALVRELLGSITKLLPKRTYRRHSDLRPRYVWEFKKKDQQPFQLLFEADDHIIIHPGFTTIRITVLDDAGKLHSEVTFGTGSRCYLRDAKLERIIDGEDPLIALEIGREGVPGFNEGKHYYAKIGERFDLVRLEDLDGKAMRNTYYVRHQECGPAIPKQSEQEWESDLTSNDRLKVLRALVWLGGTHWDARPGDKADSQAEDPEEVALVRKVRERQKVIAHLKELAESEDRWMREAAQLALSPEWGRILD